jgi:L-erythrulose 1-phosphate isomerase
MRPIFGTNWKMRNVSRDEARAYVRDVAAALPQMGDTRIFILPPATLIRDMAQECLSNQILIGAQNFHWAQEGEFTGEISTKLLKQEGAQILMVGHAERRMLFGESDEIVNRKLKRALEDEFQVVFCVGDSEKDMPAETLKKTFLQQIRTALDGVASTTILRLIVAYEPIWAIGEAANSAPSSERLAFCVDLIRETLGVVFGQAGAKIPVLYGGSVALGNCQQLVTKTGVNGLFIGRAARDPENFIALIREALRAMQEA